MHPAVKAGVAGLTSYAPLLLLRPAKRGSGVAGFVSDPRVWSLGAIALVTLGDTFGDKIGEILDTNRRLKSDEDQVKAIVEDQVKAMVEEISARNAEISARNADLERQFEEFRQNASTSQVVKRK